jgi:hypothetical protein
LPRPAGEDDPMAGLWDFWDAKRSAAPVLCRTNFDAFAFPDLLGRINLVAIEPGRPTRFRFRLFGSGMDDPLQGDVTTRAVSDIDEPAYADLVHRNYLQAYRLCRPFFAEIKADIGGGDQFHYCRLILPMSSGSGDFDILLVASARYADDCHSGGDGAILVGQKRAHRYAETAPDRVHRWARAERAGSG